MATNPDNKDYAGYGSDKAFLATTAGMLRFVERNVPTENPDVLKKVRLLQRFEWSAADAAFDWYDVELVNDV
jgi:hypothetical protein